MADTRKDFLEVFLREWEMKCQDSGFSDQGSGGKQKAGGKWREMKLTAFDPDVKAGEIRVFADTARPVAGLVLADQNTDGWLVVPVSDFTVPATEREILIGNRVYQLWNSFTASMEFIAKSWIVETLPDSDRKDIAAALLSVLCGEPLREDLAALVGLPITKTDDPRLMYEKEYAKPEKSEVVRAIEMQKISRTRWVRYVVGLAACFVMAFIVLHDTAKRAPVMDAASNNSMPPVPETVDTEPPAVPMNGEAVADMPPEDEIQELEEPPVIDAVAVVKSPVVMRSVLYAEEARREPSPSQNGRLAPPTDGSIRSRTKAKTKSVQIGPDTYARERYLDYHENEFMETKVQPLSTFGLDVDTASYATMRRYLTEMKRLPPKDSVRLEEYVNYFKYNYPEPQGDVPIAVECELAECPWNKEHKLLRVGIQARNIDKDKLPPSNLVFLLDCSGSMAANGGFEIARKSMQLLVEQLRPDDSVSIVTYASGTEVKLEATSGNDKAKILSVIESLRCGGGTYGAGGIQLAYEQAKKNFDKKSNNRVIIVTDGDFNIGVQSTQELVRMIEEKRESGIFLSVLGVGQGNYRDEMMKKLSGAGNGNYAYLDSLLEAKKVLMTEFGGTMYTVAKDVKLQLEFNPTRTASYRLLGYESRKLEAKDFNDDKKDSGEMGAGHTMTAFYELIPVGAKDAESKVDPLKYQKTTSVDCKELLTVKLRYKEPDGDTSKLVEIPVTAEEITRRDGPSQDFRFASAVAEFALILEDSKFMGNADIKAAIERAKKSKGDDDNGYRAEFIRLVELAELQLLMKPSVPGTPKTFSHTVQNGQDIFDIAVQWGVPANEIIKYNNLKDEKVSPGQTLNIPINTDRQ